MTAQHSLPRITRHYSVVILAVVLLALTACAPPSARHQADADTASVGELTVFAAASTRIMNDDLAQFAQKNGLAARLAIINAGSADLIQNLRDGAPADVLITADKESIDAAEREGLVSDPRPIARNSMVMVVPAGNPAGIRGVQDLASARLVLCAEQVPCGRTAQLIQSELNLDLSPVSEESSVSDVLGKVASGQADAGWVYVTDAGAAGNSVETLDIRGAGNHGSTLYVAASTNSLNPSAAHSLAQRIAGGELAPDWERHGFAPLNPHTQR